ncbi:FtsX-like permease family protein, partial [Patescibacteria group bacterium]|nr:FtsX-like permease family protein [Patescibacteria group bacterium]
SQIAQNFSQKKDIVDEIIYQQDVVQSLITWTNNIRRFGIILVSVLATLAFFVISVIIGMKITNRKDEIKISRLLGASRFYTKKAFLLEGIIYGILGSFIGWLIASLLAYHFANDINNFFKPVTFIRFDLNYYLKILGIANLAGVTISYLASLVGVRRYIK